MFDIIFQKEHQPKFIAKVDFYPDEYNEVSLLQARLASAVSRYTAVENLILIGNDVGLSSSLIRYAKSVCNEIGTDTKVFAVESFDNTPVKDRPALVALEALTDTLKTIWEYIIGLLTKMYNAFKGFFQKFMNKTALLAKELKREQEIFNKNPKIDQALVDSNKYLGMKQKTLVAMAVGLIVGSDKLSFDPKTIRDTDKPVEVYNEFVKRRFSAVTPKVFEIDEGRPGDAYLLANINPMFELQTDDTLDGHGYQGIDANIVPLADYANQILKSCEAMSDTDKEISTIIEECKKIYKKSGHAETTKDKGKSQLEDFGQVGAAMTKNNMLYLSACNKALTEIVNVIRTRNACIVTGGNP